MTQTNSLPTAVAAHHSFKFLGFEFGIFHRPVVNPIFDAAIILEDIKAWGPEEIIWITGHFELPIEANMRAKMGAKLLHIVPIGADYGSRPILEVDCFVAGNPYDVGKPIKKVAVISNFGTGRAASAIAQILCRYGISNRELTCFLAQVLPGVTISAEMAALIEECQERPFARYLERDIKKTKYDLHPSIVAAKFVCHERRRQALDRSDDAVPALSTYLEQEALSQGWKNWATMSGMVTKPGRSAFEQNPELAKLNEAGCLVSPDARVVIEQVYALWRKHFESPSSMWSNRPFRLLEALILALFDRHKKYGTQPSLHELQAAVHHLGPLGIYQTMRDYLTGRLSGEGKDPMMLFLTAIPGFKLDRLLNGELQLGTVQEQLEFTTMQAQKFFSLVYHEVYGDGEP